MPTPHPPPSRLPLLPLSSLPLPRPEAPPQASKSPPPPQQVRDLGTGCFSTGRQRGVEPRHVHHRLRIRALTNRQIQGLSVAPVTRTVPLVVVVERVRPVRLILFRQIDSRSITHREIDSAGDQLAQPNLQTELVEIDVARMLDRAEQIDRAVALVIPAPEIPCAVLIPAGTRNRHVLGRRHHAVLERDDARRQLERRAWWIPTLNRLVDERATLVLQQLLVIVDRNSAGELVRIPARRRVQRQHFTS